MKFNLKGKLIALASLVMVGMTSLTVAFTAAAYMVFENHYEQITVDFDYGQYFGGGDGKSDATAYQISTPEHLRNLSQLVGLGVFGREDYFKVTQNITYGTSDPVLRPIGTFNAPFYSQFNGGGFVISNLRVEGVDEQDVGMFGYVANGATIKNFRLVTPTVTTKRTTPGEYSFSAKDGNALRTSGVVNQDLCKAFTITKTGTDVSVGGKVVGNTGFKIELGGNAVIPANYTLMCDVSDPSVFAGVVTNTGTQDKPVFSFNLNTTTVNNKFEEKYVTLDFYIFGIVGVDGKNRFSRLSLERYKIFVKYDDKVKKPYFVCGADEPNAWKPMLHGDPEVQEIDKKHFVATKIEHAFYCGIVVGVLEGTALQILVYKPKMVIEGGPFISNSFLVGRHISDDNKSLLAEHELKVQSVGDESTASSATITDAKNDDDIGIVENGKLEFTNSVYPGIYNNPDSQTTPVPGLIDKKYQMFIRAYATNESYGAVPADKKTQFVTYQNAYYIGQGQESMGPKKAFSLRRDSKSWLTFLNEDGEAAHGSCRAMYASDLLFFWASLPNANENNNFFNTLFSTSKNEFSLNVEIDYVFHDFDKPNDDKTDSEHKIKINAARKRQGILERRGIFLRWDSGIYGLPWELVHAETGTSLGGCMTGGIDPYTKIKTNTVTLGSQDSNGISVNDEAEVKALKANKETDATIIDSNKNKPGGVSFLYIDANKETDPRVFRDNDITRVNDSANPNRIKPDYANDIVPIQTKKFNFVSKYETRDWSDKDYMTPLIMLGMEGSNKPNSKGYQLDIFGFRVVISSLSGNVEQSLIEIDFSGFNSGSIPTGDQFSHSGVKVKTSLFNDVEEYNSAPTNIQPLAVIPGVNMANGGCGNYTITASRNSANSGWFGPREGSDVTFNYKFLKNIGADTIKLIIPKNQAGYKEAIIQQNNNI